MEGILLGHANVKTRLTLVIFVVGVLFSMLVPFESRAAATASTPIGLWLTPGPDGALIRIENCGGKLCGTIVKLEQPLNEAGRVKRDEHNPNRALQSRTVVGITMFSGLAEAVGHPDEWSGGDIYNPQDGKMYSCTITLEDANTLEVRGYFLLSFLGKTSIWKRAS